MNPPNPPPMRDGGTRHERAKPATDGNGMKHKGPRVTGKRGSEMVNKWPMPDDQGNIIPSGNDKGIKRAVAMQAVMEYEHKEGRNPLATVLMATSRQ